jgi:hypothetical protein
VTELEDLIVEESSSMRKFDTEAEAIEFGGLRVPSVMTETLESFHVVVLRGEPKEPRDDTLLLLSLVDPLEPLDVEYRCFTELGIPSHLELTLGTLAGSF